MKLRRFLNDSRGASAAEFALVLPLLLLLLFGIIDVGRYMWSINRAEKAAQMGVRMAVVTDPVAAAINESYVGKCGLTQGDMIPVDDACFTAITCSRTDCGGDPADSGAFDAVLARVQAFMPEVDADNLEITYSPSGIGYAGNPNGPDLAPLVTVRLFDLGFTPTIMLALGEVDLPEVRSTLTLEDGRGAVSN